MLMLNQLKGHEATFGVLHVDSPLDHVFLITELAQFRKRFGSGCHPIIALVLRILKLDLNVSRRLALRRLLLVPTTEICYWRESPNECLRPSDSLLDRLLRSLNRRKFGRGLAAVPSYSASVQRFRSRSNGEPLSKSIRWLLGAL